jgi:drug/metabolite transporter (DMT)-like permease
MTICPGVTPEEAGDATLLPVNYPDADGSARNRGLSANCGERMQQRQIIQAIGLMLVAMILIPSGDAAGKLLVANHGVSPLFVAWSRFLIGAVVFLPFAGRFEAALFFDWRIWLRAVFIVGGISSILTALRSEPISNVYAIFFAGPILSYFLSAVLLKEQISRSRTTLLLIGFGGVLLVVKPGPDMGPGAGFALLAGACYGCYLVANRWLVTVARPRMMLMSQLIIGALLLMPFGITGIPELSPAISSLSALSAIASVLGNLALIFAYRRAEASKLAPLLYVQLIAATLFGALLFGTWPDSLAFLGITILLVSGFASFLIRPKQAAALS